MSKNNFLKGSAAYSFSNALLKFGTLLFLPVLTRLLSPEEYGIIGSFSTISTLLGIILGLGFYTPQMKKFSLLKNKKKEYGNYLFSINIFLLLFILVCFLIVNLPFSRNLFYYFFDETRVNYLYLKVIFITSGFSVFSNLVLVIMKLEERYYKISLGSLGKFLINYIVAIVLIKNYGFGALGVFIGNAVSSFCLFLFIYLPYLKKFKVGIQIDEIRYTIKNGIPMIFVELTDQIVNLSDRLILLKFISLEVVGLYSLAYTGAQILGVFSGGLLNAWLPLFYNSLEKNKMKVIDKWHSIFSILTIICIFGQLFSREIINLIFPNNYFGVLKYLPYLLPAILIQSLYSLDYFFHYNEESKYIPYFTVLCMIINLGINVTLIPKLGALVAVWSTVVAFLLRAGLQMYIIRRRYSIFFDYKRIISCILSTLNPLVIYLFSLDITIEGLFIKSIYLVVTVYFLLDKKTLIELRS